MNEQDVNIIWQDVPAKKESEAQMEVPPSMDKIYDSLYEELKEKCNPSRYLVPYNKEKVDIANSLYKELMAAGFYDNNALLGIRRKAVEQLSIKISTKKLYLKLKELCNPASYMQPYNDEAVKQANEFYARIEERKDSIEDLEVLEKEINMNECLTEYRNNQKSTDPTNGDYRWIIITTWLFLVLVFIIIYICLY